MVFNLLYIYPSVSKVHAGSFHVSVIHQTLTWTTSTSTRIFKVRTWSFLCLRIHTGVGHTPTASQRNIFDSDKLSQMFLVLLAGFKSRVIESWVGRSTNWATPSSCGVNLWRLEDANLTTLQQQRYDCVCVFHESLCKMSLMGCYQISGLGCMTVSHTDLPPRLYLLGANWRPWRTAEVVTQSGTSVHLG